MVAIVSLKIILNFFIAMYRVGIHSRGTQLVEQRVL